MTTNLNRNYSQRTLKILFGLSGDQCAHPNCTTTLIEPATDESDTLVTGQICHIYAVSSQGPRGKHDLTENECNAPENLILLCPHHHRIVDGQHEAFTAEMLLKWKREHEEKTQRKKLPELKAIHADVLSQTYFPVSLVDKKIQEEIEKLRKSRFFTEFDRKRYSLRLGEQIAKHQLSVGTDEIRSWGLAWCARLLFSAEDLDKANEYLEIARSLGDSVEIQISEAFLLSQKGNQKAALKSLAKHDLNSARSASLMIVANHEGPERALRWINDAGYTANDLDSDGKCILLIHQLQFNHWEESADTTEALTNINFAETPALHHYAAVAKLITAVPSDFRNIVVTQVPFHLFEFPLASNAVSMDARRAAHRYFVDGTEVAKELNFPHAASRDDEYALWLELRDPSLRDSGRNRLQRKLRDLSTALGYVHFGLQFGIKLDLEAVEREIERDIAIHNGMTKDAAIACFALSFKKSSPEIAASYIHNYQHQLTEHIDSKLIQYRLVELYSSAGFTDKAKSIFKSLVEEGHPTIDENKLRQIISETKGNSPVELHKEQYEESGSLDHLMNLVCELENHQLWNDLCEYGLFLFRETCSLEDAERLAYAFTNAHKSEELVLFLDENSEFLLQSNKLKLLYAWGLYHEGALIKSREELVKLKEDTGDPNQHALIVNLGIAMGNWTSLLTHIANEYQNRNERCAKDLIRTAQLAVHLESPHAKDIIFAATSKAGDDATIFADAYLMASSSSLEDDPQVNQWLKCAVDLSGDDGPLQRMSFRNIVEKKPEWDRKKSETQRLLVQGQIPIFIAAQSLNRTLIHHTVFPALVNLTEADPRRRSVIPTYSGKRTPRKFVPIEKTVAIDATALLTLGFLGILDITLDKFEAVYIPHSTLGWLFNERAKTSFHQPSRIAGARKIRDLLATNRLEKFMPKTVGNSELSVQIGDELAALIAEAENVREGENSQHIVVCPAPIHRLSSLMEEEADLTAHELVLCSCIAVVSKLKQKGIITADEEKQANVYLQLQERPWPNQPDISDGAILYFNDLSVRYFLHLGLLEKLKDAGFRPVISPTVISEADVLISYEQISDDVKTVIEKIRSTLNSRIESGQVRVGRKCTIDDKEDNSIQEHPSLAILNLGPKCGAVVSDDRFINQNLNVDTGDTMVPILSTLDLLDALVTSASISADDLLEYRTKLRRAGYAFVPVNEEELEQCLCASAVVDGKVVETAELKAIRQSLLQVRMHDWLQLPQEIPWLDGTLKTFIKVLKNFWESNSNIDDIKARSDWIADHIDARGWAHCIAPENSDNFVKIGRGAYILGILMPPENVQKETVDAYWVWVENKILAPTKEQHPDLYEWLVENYRDMVRKVADAESLEGDNFE